MPTLAPGQTVLTSTPVFEVDALPPGTYRFQLVVEDGSGNASLPVERVVTVLRLTVGDPVLGGPVLGPTLGQPVLGQPILAQPIVVQPQAGVARPASTVTATPLGGIRIPLSTLTVSAPRTPGKAAP